MTNRRRTTPGPEGIEAARADARRVSLKEIEDARRGALRDIGVQLAAAQRRAEEVDRLLRDQGREADADELDDLLGYLQLAVEAHDLLTQ